MDIRVIVLEEEVTHSPLPCFTGAEHSFVVPAANTDKLTVSKRGIPFT